VVAGRVRVIHLHGLAGLPGLSPALDALDDDIDVVAPVLPGFDGASGFEAPSDYLGWLTLVWDALDATGALPCPVIGSSVGGMLAAELAVLRPEAVSKLALLGPLGVWDDDHPGEDPFAVGASHRLELLFAGDVPAPFTEQFADRGELEQPVAQYLLQIAAASLVWPLADHGIRTRLHRLRGPTLVVWGEDDRIAPVETAVHWPATEPLVTVPGAGHLVEWDAPEAVASALSSFLRA
jgi:pimeloyl-ACP methyl ester carboxylesterase